MSKRDDKFLVQVHETWYLVADEQEAWEEAETMGEEDCTEITFAEKGPYIVNAAYGVNVDSLEQDLDENMGVIHGEVDPINEETFEAEYIEFLRSYLAKHHPDRFTVENERTLTRSKREAAP